jgi:hypothetical protein
MSLITLLHGTDHIITKPDYDLGKSTNDYGKGFYCTRLSEMAKEWACKDNKNGFVNEYSFEDSTLKTLNLSDGNHTILNWIALLLKYRTFDLSSEIAVDARNYIIEHFLPDTHDYDVIVGYRADDSYFSYAQSFVENTLPLRSLNQALSLGKLGLQTVLVSPKAFEKLTFVNAEPVDKEIYYPKFFRRDMTARETYRKEIKGKKSYKDDIFVMDILREEMQNDDARIQRIILK